MTPTSAPPYTVSDGSILVVTRPEGTSVGLGGACGDATYKRPLTPGLGMLETVLYRLSEQQDTDPTCAALPTSPP